MYGTCRDLERLNIMRVRSTARFVDQSEEGYDTITFMAASMEHQ